MLTPIVREAIEKWIASETKRHAEVTITFPLTVESFKTDASALAFIPDKERKKMVDKL